MKATELTTDVSFESLKKINQHGIEYWSARDLQSCLGYSKWQRFDPAIKKAIKSCQQSGNNPQNHFTGADKMVGIGSQTERKVTDLVEKGALIKSGELRHTRYQLNLKSS